MRVQLERVPGVSEVRVWGGAERQVKIYVDPAKLAERQITLSEVRNAIRARNRDVSGGDLDSGKRRYLLRTIGRFETTAQTWKTWWWRLARRRVRAPARPGPC